MFMIFEIHKMSILLMNLEKHKVKLYIRAAEDLMGKKQKRLEKYFAEQLKIPTTQCCL